VIYKNTTDLHQI